MPAPCPPRGRTRQPYGAEVLVCTSRGCLGGERVVAVAVGEGGRVREGEEGGVEYLVSGAQAGQTFYALGDSPPPPPKAI